MPTGTREENRLLPCLFICKGYYILCDGEDSVGSPALSSFMTNRRLSDMFASISSSLALTSSFTLPAKMPSPGKREKRPLLTTAMSSCFSDWADPITHPKLQLPPTIVVLLPAPIHATAALQMNCSEILTTPEGYSIPRPGRTLSFLFSTLVNTDIPL